MFRNLSTVVSGLLLVGVLALFGVAVFMLLPGRSLSPITGAASQTRSPTEATLQSPRPTALPRPTSAGTPTPELALSYTPVAEPTKDIGPEPLPRQRDPNEPYLVRVAGSRITAVETMTHEAPVIAIGTVLEVQSPRWTTPDGKRPANPWEQKFGIFTPIIIQVDEYLKGGEVRQTTLTLRGAGGQIDADGIFYDNEGQDGIAATSFATGQRVLLFLTHETAVTGLGNMRGVMERYTLTSNGRAANKVRSVPLSQLREEIRQNLPVGTPVVPNPL